MLARVFFVAAKQVDNNNLSAARQVAVITIILHPTFNHNMLI